MPYDTTDAGVRWALELAQAVVACESVPETPATAAAATRLGEHGRAALAGMISCAPAGVQPVGELADLALVCTVQPGNRLACRACVSGKGMKLASPAALWQHSASFGDDQHKAIHEMVHLLGWEQGSARSLMYARGPAPVRDVPDGGASGASASEPDDPDVRDQLKEYEANPAGGPRHEAQAVARQCADGKLQCRACFGARATVSGLVGLQQHASAPRFASCRRHRAIKFWLERAGYSPGSIRVEPTSKANRIVLPPPQQQPTTKRARTSSQGPATRTELTLSSSGHVVWPPVVVIHNLPTKSFPLLIVDADGSPHDLAVQPWHTRAGRNGSTVCWFHNEEERELATTSTSLQGQRVPTRLQSRLYVKQDTNELYGAQDVMNMVAATAGLEDARLAKTPKLLWRGANGAADARGCALLFFDDNVDSLEAMRKLTHAAETMESGRADWEAEQRRQRSRRAPPNRMFVFRGSLADLEDVDPHRSTKWATAPQQEVEETMKRIQQEHEERREQKIAAEREEVEKRYANEMASLASKMESLESRKMEELQKLEQSYGAKLAAKDGELAMKDGELAKKDQEIDDVEEEYTHTTVFIGRLQDKLEDMKAAYDRVVEVGTIDFSAQRKSDFQSFAKDLTQAVEERHEERTRRRQLSLDAKAMARSVRLPAWAEHALNQRRE